MITATPDLSSNSQSRWWKPLVSVPPMYMPGRRRTGSRPCRTVMCSAVYDLSAAISVDQLGLGGGRLGEQHPHHGRLARQGVPTAAARGDVVAAGADRDLLA